MDQPQRTQEKMQRPRSSHRKSLSTSALSVLAADGGPRGSKAATPSRRGGVHHPPLPSIPSQSALSQYSPSEHVTHKTAIKRLSQPSLTSVREGLIAETCELPTFKSNERKHQSAAGDLRAVLNDLRSVRSSGRRRLRALRELEQALLSGCTNTQGTLVEMVQLKAHTPVLAILARHTASLAKRASSSSLPVGDELVVQIAPELESALAVLQGLTLLSRTCKSDVGERWVLEMFLDLLLLLRAQTSDTSGMSGKPPVYAVLDLLFCILVDSPANSRTFEDLAGLEAVVRVLKGTGVAKQVRMKCCEFLYFYLLPEGATSLTPTPPSFPFSTEISEASITSSLTSSMSSTETASPSRLPPLLAIDRSAAAAAIVPLAGSGFHPRSPDKRWADMDLPFVPQTPRKPAKPSLGFLTPSTTSRRISSSSTATNLTPVPASPPNAHPNGGNGGASDQDDGSLTRKDSAAWAAAVASGMVGLGQGNRGSSDLVSRTSSGSSSSSVTVVPRRNVSPPSNSTGSRTNSNPSASAFAPPPPPSPRLPRSSTQPVLASADRVNRTDRTNSDIPASISSQASSSSSRDGPGATPHPSRISLASGLMSNLAPIPSRRGISKSPLGQSATTESALPLPPLPPSRIGNGVAPRMRHSRTQSSLSSLAGVDSSDKRTASVSSAIPRNPRAFPNELTRGIPPKLPSALPITSTKSTTAAAASYTPSAPLNPSRRIGSSRHVVLQKDEDVRSVAEKKELLGKWLGNVDQLVEGVEKVGFLGSRPEL